MNNKPKSTGERSNPFDLWTIVDNSGSHNLFLCFWSYQVETTQDKCFPDCKIRNKADVPQNTEKLKASYTMDWHLLLKPVTFPTSLIHLLKLIDSARVAVSTSFIFLCFVCSDLVLFVCFKCFFIYAQILIPLGDPPNFIFHSESTHPLSEVRLDRGPRILSSMFLEVVSENIHVQDCSLFISHLIYLSSLSHAS